ncbi:MAG: IS1634 family transposase [Coleofasciculaceae cyanobacterium]
MTPSPGEIQVENLDHLGLVAGIIDEIGMVETINSMVGIEAGEIVNAGLVVKAIILNGLGFVSRPLYLFTQFFQGKATEHLLGEGIKAEHLNDDKIGRVMDKLYKQGLTNIFLSITLAAIKRYGISTQYTHLDATTISVEGKYENAQEEVLGETEEKSESLLNQEPQRPIKITYGYSRDKRPDLKQFLLELMVSGDGDIPLFIRAADGNESEQAVFGKLLKEFKSRVDFESIMVADSALYSQNNLLLMQELLWITRVPLSVKGAQHLVREVSAEELVKSAEYPSYSWVEKKSNYGGIEQRWLLIESEKRRKSDLEKLEKKLKKKLSEAQKLQSRLSRQKFESTAAAKATLKAEQKKLKYYRLDLVKVLKEQKQQSLDNLYKVELTISENTEIIAAEKKRAGRFILATNIEDSQQLSASEMFKAYREQQAPERGFAFLKDPLFFADSVFLKTPQRIETMAMLMGLCLLVYKLGQRQLRLNLGVHQSGVKNQLGKLTQKPTLRWIFQCFQGIHVVVVNGVKQISNLTTDRSSTINFFPEACQQYYSSA